MARTTDEKLSINDSIRFLMENIQAVEDGTLDLAKARVLEGHSHLLYRTAELALEASRDVTAELLDFDEEDLARWRSCLKDFREAVRRRMNRSFGPS